MKSESPARTDSVPNDDDDKKTLFKISMETIETWPRTNSPTHRHPPTFKVNQWRKKGFAVPKEWKWVNTRLELTCRPSTGRWGEETFGSHRANTASTSRNCGRRGRLWFENCRKRERAKQREKKTRSRRVRVGRQASRCRTKSPTWWTWTSSRCAWWTRTTEVSSGKVALEESI